jgi:hypothetical protein
LFPFRGGCGLSITLKEAIVDSDLADAIDGLKSVFLKRKIEATFGKAPPELVETLKKELRIPKRYRDFLLAANPLKVESVTPVERIRFIPADELVKAQSNVTSPESRKPAWVVIGESSLLSDPYFLDTSKPDPEGDCPVYTAMSGQDKWVPTLVGSTFAQFLRIVSTAMEIAAGFGDAIMDDEDEDSFREALGPKVKVIDAAAKRAGHWT